LGHWHLGVVVIEVAVTQRANDRRVVEHRSAVRRWIDERDDAA
jgi:hypothetical protein